MNSSKNLRTKDQGQLPGRPMRRPDRARRRLLMEHLEPRTVLSNFVISGNVGNDVILLRRDPKTRPWPRCGSTA